MQATFPVEKAPGSRIEIREFSLERMVGCRLISKFSKYLRKKRYGP
jgi:hypothetical protein